MFPSERFNLAPRLGELLARTHQLKLNFNRGELLDELAGEEPDNNTVYCEFTLTGELTIHKNETLLVQLMTCFRDSRKEGCDEV